MNPEKKPRTHSRVQLSEEGKNRMIIREDRPYQHNGLLVGKTPDGFLLVIPDTLETVSRYHPSFWEPEDPEFRRKHLKNRAVDPKYKEKMETMPPGTVVQMTVTGKIRKNIPQNRLVRGTLISWTWKMHEGKPIDSIKVIVEGLATTQHYDPDDWETGSLDPQELKKALVSETAVPACC